MVIEVQNSRGTDCTGISGATNRTLTLDNSGTNNTILTVWVQNNVLTTADYTHDVTTNIITLLGVINDAFYISVLYQFDTGTVSSTTYATIAELQRYMNLSGTAEFSTTQFQDALDAAEGDINEETNTVFVNGTVVTPSWTQVTNEKHTGKGVTDRTYFLEQYPIADLSATVTGTAVTADDTTIYVDSTNGFPTSGYFCIEDDKIQYTGKTTSTFTGCTSVSAHGTATVARPYIIEISTTAEGQATNWTVLEHDKSYDINLKNGRVKLNNSSLESTASNTVAFSRFPQYQIANRLRATYLTGVSTIPKDINRLCIKLAARELKHSVVNHAHSLGMDGFNPEPLDIDDKWIERKFKEYKKYQFQLI